MLDTAAAAGRTNSPFIYCTRITLHPVIWAYLLFLPPSSLVPATIGRP